MPNNQANLKQWLDKSEIDFFTHFVKAWIPFNAWFRDAYGSTATEREILDQIKADGNRIRSRMMAKFEGEEREAQEIRNHIAALHGRLSADPLKDQKGRRISFEEVRVGRNLVNPATLTAGGWTYAVERLDSPPRIQCKAVDRNRVIRVDFTHDGKWDLEVLEENQDFLRMNPTRASGLRQCYRSANPDRVESLLAGAGDRNPLTMDSYKFIRDGAKIFAGLIDVLYAMRNMLFHGELVPDTKSNETYEPAYHLVRHLVKTIT